MIMYQPKISIITVCYNSFRTIEQCIWSVINQSYKNIEFIIIDGASTDGTIDIIRKYDNEISNWISEPDNGIYNAMNKGVSVASGEYIEIIGSDDCLTDIHVIENVVKELQDKPDILSCREWSVDEESGYQWILENSFAKDYSNFNGGMVPHAAMFVKRNLLHRYPFDESYLISSDHKFFLQCYYDSSITIKYSILLVAFFSNSGTSSNSKATKAEDLRIFRELGLDYDGNENFSYKAIVRSYLIMFAKKWLPFFELLRRIYHKYFAWERHHCTNAICRWCKRYTISS